ncbi:hypothetical protein SAMN05216548_1278 [Faunimonas pinastri]|uniref:Uncharacterized protein n=1 Tax=Faunimonas pinastri TaxID=1855383 RepID=A0A1H9QCR0_9HYPH|nr:hypothetical protein [Faunimonas pinastri]SER58217.1 hypothetical protein SAMN05216548_1278 [Faunimonas pinastri]
MSKFDLPSEVRNVADAVHAIIAECDRVASRADGLMAQRNEAEAIRTAARERLLRAELEGASDKAAEKDLRTADETLARLEGLTSAVGTMKADLAERLQKAAEEYRAALNRWAGAREREVQEQFKKAVAGLAPIVAEFNGLRNIRSGNFTEVRIGGFAGVETEFLRGIDRDAGESTSAVAAVNLAIESRIRRLKPVEAKRFPASPLMVA